MSGLYSTISKRMKSGFYDRDDEEYDLASQSYHRDPQDAYFDYVRETMNSDEQNKFRDGRMTFSNSVSEPNNMVEPFSIRAGAASMANAPEKTYNPSLGIMNDNSLNEGLMRKRTNVDARVAADNTINVLDEKINAGRTLTPDEEVEYSRAKNRQSYTQFGGLQDLMAERNQYINEIENVSRTEKTRGAASSKTFELNKRVLEVEDEIKNLTGWDDNTLRTQLQYEDRVRSRQNANAERADLRINASDNGVQKFGKALGNTAYALMQNGAINNAVGMANDYVDSNRPKGFGANVDSVTHRNADLADEAIAQVNNNIKSKGGQFAFNTAYSTVDSVVKRIPAILMTAAGVPGAISEAATLVPYWLQSYNDEYKSARERGATEKDARYAGIASGSIEALTEIIPIGNVIKNAGGKNAAKSFVKTLVKQASEEGLEEAVGTIVSEIADQIIFGDDEEVETRFNERVNANRYDADGNERSELQAVAGAVKDLFGETIENFASGFISGGLSTAPSMYIGAKNMQTNQQNISDTAAKIAENVKGDTDYEQSVKAQAEKYAQSPAQAYADRIDDTTEKGKNFKAQVQELADKQARGEKLTTGENYFLTNAMDRLSKESLDVPDYSVVPNEFRSPVSSITEEQARERLASAAKDGDAAQMGKIYQEMKNSSSQNVRNNVDEIFDIYSGMAQSNGANSEQIEAFKKSSQDAYIAGLNGENRSNLGALSREAQQAYDEGYLRFKNNNITEQSANRKQAKIESLPSDTARSVYESNIKDDDNVNQYNTAWDRFFSAGRTGLDFEEELKNGSNRYIADVFDKNTLKAMYDAGVQQTQAEEGAKASNQLFKGMGIKNTVGSFEDIRTVKDDTVDFEAYRALSNFIGQNVVLADTSSYDFIEGENARFIPKESKIVINADASVAQGLHEALGEFTEFYNSEGFEVVRSALNKAASKNLGARRYNEILNNYKSAYERAGQSSNDIEMSREMTNDMLVSMMATDKGRKELATLLSENENKKQANSAAQKIKDIFHKIAKSIKSIIDNSKLSSLQREVLEKGYKDLENNVDLFMDAFKVARENAMSTEGVEKDTHSNRYSIAISEEEIKVIEEETEIFTDQLNEWDGKNPRERFDLCDTPNVLKNLGMEDNKIVLDSSKLIRIFNDHPEMKNIIRQLPRMIHDPIAVTKSLTDPESIVIFGDVRDYNENPVILILIQNPTDRNGATIDITKLKNSYARSKSQIMLTEEGTYYVCPDKKITTEWEQGTRLQLPVASSNSGYIKSITGLNEKGNNKYSLNVDSEGNKLTEQQAEYFKDSKVVDENGNLKTVYHGTGRADRVGYVFDPNRATSGPMAYFTDNEQIATNYSKDKADTSISRDERYDSYYTQFRMNIDGKDMSIGEAWDNLPARVRAEIRNKAAHITFDDDYENIIYDESKTTGLGNFDKYLLSEHKNNYLEALVDAWLEQGDLFGQEERFREVLSLVGLNDVEYLDPDFRDEKVYKEYLNITKPFETSNDYNEKFIEGLESWWNEQDQSSYVTENYAADMWDKTGITVEQWIDRARNDIENNNTHAWTVIPDAVTDYLKSQGYDGIEDQGGKLGGEGHTVYIPFYSNQIKETTNLKPTEDVDIRYSLDTEGGWVSFDDATDDEFAFMNNTNVVSILEEGMEALKNQTVNEKRINDIAVKLRDEFHSTYPIRTLQKNLQAVFAYMQTQDHINYNEMLGVLNDIAKPVIEASVEMEGEEEYKKFRDFMKSYNIRLTEQQKKEVASTFGSYQKYHQMIMPLNISNNGDIDLDQVWDELSMEYPYLFPMDTVEGDKPLVLYDALMALKPTPKNDFGGDADDVAHDLAMRIIEEYIEGNAKSRIKQYNEAYQKQLKEAYDKKLKELGAKQYASISAKNKERAQQAKEKQDSNDMKNKIRTNANKLLTWISKPSENRHVPADLVSPVLEFLKALDFVEPTITMVEDGKWEARMVEGSVNGRVKWSEPITGATRQEVYDKIQARLAQGQGSQNQRKWTDRMNDIKELYEKARDEAQFEDSTLDTIVGNLDGSLYELFKDVLIRNKDVIDINNISSKDLKIVNNVLRNIMAAINKGNQANSINADIINLAQQTMQQAEGKNIAQRYGLTENFHKFFHIDNVTPSTFMTIIGDSAKKLYKALRDGMNVRTWDIKKASDYMETTLKDLGIDMKELKQWTGATADIHIFNLSEGEIKMTTAQIMGLYETLKRTGSKDRTVGGIQVDNIDRGKYKKRVTQDKTIHLNPKDLGIIFGTLTPEQKSLADKMQRYLADECSKDGNEVSMRLYGYAKFEDSTYYPYSVDKETLDTRDSTEKRDSYTGIERSSFTHTLQEDAVNPLIIKDIFDVFSNHVVDMAAYHGYAAANKDVMRWMNYREKSKDNNTGFITFKTNKDAINKLSNSKSGVDYVKKLLLDLNGTEKSNYIGNVTEQLVGHYKASSIGFNMRVFVQQPTAYLRAANLLDYKYMFGNMLNVPKALRYSKIAKEQNATALWKSWGYYETNIGKSMKEVITGVTDPIDSVVEKSMILAGLADDYTWGSLYYAVEKEQRAKLKGQNVSEEEFRKAVNDRFDEVIDKTQVVDSTLHRSQLMRSKDALNKLQTAYMAEPTKSYNMLLEAAMTDTKGDKKLKSMIVGRAVAVWTLVNIANAAAQSTPDAFRYDTDDDEWLDVWIDNFKKNLVDNMNPLNMIPILKDIAPSITNFIKGAVTGEVENLSFTSSSRLDTAGLTAILDAATQDIKWAYGNTNKTGYGLLMANLKPISQVTGISMYNLLRDVVALTNQFHDDITTTVKTATTYKKGIVIATEDERSNEDIKKEITDAVENGVSIKDAQSYLTSQYKDKYYDLIAEGKMTEAEELASMIAPAYAMTGMSDEDIDSMIDEWKEESISYSPLDKAISSGEGIKEAIAKVREAKDDDKIVNHIMDKFSSTVDYETENNTDSSWLKNVEAALKEIDGTSTYDSVKEDMENKAAEKAEKKAKDDAYNALKADLFNATEAMDGAAGRQAVQAMKEMGKDNGDIKDLVSKKYHPEWLEAKGDPAKQNEIKNKAINTYMLIDSVIPMKTKKNRAKYEQEWKTWVNKQK